MDSHTVAAGQMPALVWALPFVALLLAIALLPLVPRVSHWWERNANKLAISVVLAIVVSIYYALRGYGFAGSEAGGEALARMLGHAVVGDYIPFMVLLFSLYAISGGIRLTGDVPAHPSTNCAILLAGAILASAIGTTGASMLLIRPLLQINRERRHVSHTVIFFIFLVSNIGGSLLPVGDPPLFLGYLRGVPFFWTFNLLLPWALAIAAVMCVYLVIEIRAYRRESPKDIMLDETLRAPIRLAGGRNVILLAGVVLAVAVLVPGRAMPLVGWVLPDWFIREIVLVGLGGLSLFWTPKALHRANSFTFHALAEVAALFIGIFVTMQVPIEILKVMGPDLGISSPMQYFWCTGILSSFLDNAPTYVVFFELAGTSTAGATNLLHGVETLTGSIGVRDLLAISCGAVFMGANTYIGNGPNFLVKAIAENHGVKMPGFFGYMLYSAAVLLPVFVIISLLFFL
ncbi:MAG: sodium:proton antiporter [FCB group bacterium]|jgi:Na+/H+ antiporter NhaD/arsenite permease-like protein|nr:sodium:proton antiporter [FCB group bacterium]